MTDVDSSIDTSQQRDSLRERVRELELETEKLKIAAAKDRTLKPYQIELLKLQKHLEAEQIPMIVLFEGRDASGKGGTIRRIARFMNEKRYQVVALGKPTETQGTQWYKRQYRDFIRGVTGFEKDIVRQGTVLVKLYFSVDKDTQAKRFARRQNDALRQWKLSEIDLQAQEYWDDFTEMKHRMLERTSSGSAPWTIIRSNSKPKARLNAMKVILNAIDYEGRDPDLDFTIDGRDVDVSTGEMVIMPGNVPHSVQAEHRFKMLLIMIRSGK